MDDRKPRIELGKSIYNENETVAFLYGFDSIERCDYYTVEELDYIIECMENTKKKMKEKDETNQMNFDWRIITDDTRQKEKEGLVE